MSFSIDVGQLLKRTGNEEKIRAEEKISFPEDDLVITAPVRIDIRLVNTGESILVTGEIETKVTLNCVRCLKDYERNISVDLEEEYVRQPKRVQAGRKKGVKPGEEDAGFSIGEDGSINLTEAVRQNLLTALPIKPLCSIDCKGLDEGKS